MHGDGKHRACITAPALTGCPSGRARAGATLSCSGVAHKRRVRVPAPVRRRSTSPESQPRRRQPGGARAGRRAARQQRSRCNSMLGRCGAHTARNGRARHARDSTRNPAARRAAHHAAGAPAAAARDAAPEPWGTRLLQHVGRAVAVNGAADGLASAQDLPHGALQLAGHAARAHDARNGDHVVQRNVAVVRDVLHLRARKAAGGAAQRLGSALPRRRRRSGRRCGAAARAARLWGLGLGDLRCRSQRAACRRGAPSCGRAAAPSAP